MDNSIPKDEPDAFQGTDLNENTWVPFNDEAEVPPRPTPANNQPQQMTPQYIQHPYMGNDASPTRRERLDKPNPTSSHIDRGYTIWIRTFSGVHDDKQASNHS